MPNRAERRRRAAIARKAIKAKVSTPAKPTPQPSSKPDSLLAFSAPVRIAAAAGDAAAPRTFEIDVYTGEPMAIFPWDHPVVIDLDTLDLTAQSIPALYDHCPDIDYVVGQVNALRVENGTLKASGRFVVTDTPIERNYALKVITRADKGYQWQASIGGMPSAVETYKAGEQIVVNGRSYTGPCHVARGVVPREVSFVVLGGDRRTSAIVARKTPIKGAAMSFEEWLLSLGFEDAASLSEVQRVNLQAIYTEEHGEGDDGSAVEPQPGEGSTPATPAGPTNAGARRVPIQATGGNRQTTDQSIQLAIQARRRAEAAEEERIVAIRRILAGSNLELEVTVNGQKSKVGLQAHAIAEGWDANRTELERLRLERGNGPAIHARSHDSDCSIQALQAAMILRAGGRLDHPSYQSQQAVAMGLPHWLRAGLNSDQRQQAMEWGHRYSSLSAVDLCREACRLNNVQAGHNRQDMIRAAFSSGSALTSIFTTNVNAILLASYLEVQDTTMGWVTEQDVNDFKTNERPRVSLGDGLAKLPRGGEADHSKISDSYESYKISRYAKQFQVDEQDMIDDNLGVFATQPKRHGDAARRLRPDLVYAILLANPTLTATSRALFNTTDGNLGSNSALSAANLKAGITAMMNLREGTANLNLTPTHLIVPPTLRWTGEELIDSPTIVIAGTAGSVTERGVKNTLSGKGMKLVADARLENGVVNPDDNTSQSGSASTWFLACALADTIEVGYLSGTGRAPQVRSEVLSRGMWGINWDVKMDIGAKALDWRGLRKTTA